MKKEHYLVLDPDGTFRWITADRSHLLDAFHSALDCSCVECVCVSSDGILCAIVDESGIINGKPVNRYASILYPGAFSGSYLFGSVLFCRIGLWNGEPDWFPLNSFALHYLSHRLGLPIPPCPKGGDQHEN